LYVVVTIEEWIGLLPDDNIDVEKAALSYLRETLEGTIDPELGVIVAVLNATILSDGLILPMPGDPKAYYLVRYDALVYRPVQLEVVRGSVVEAREIGLFVDLGPLDGFVHKSQIMDEPVEYLPDRRGFRGTRTGRIIEVGDIVRARVSAIGRDRRRGGIRIGLTMRQPYLGKEDWITGE